MNAASRTRAGVRNHEDVSLTGSCGTSAFARVRRLGLMAILSGSAACTSAREPADSTGSVDTSAPRDTAVAPSRTTLTADGWGPLHIGMTRAAVVAAAGPDANPDAVGGADPQACDQFRPRSAPQGLLVMIERDTLTRISVSRRSGIRTDAAFGIGDPAAAVERHYGTRAAVTPHQYQEAPARYITVWMRGHPPAASARGIVYEIGRDGRVIHIHVGGPSIQHVEGCL